jgi:hypothetical protein
VTIKFDLYGIKLTWAAFTFPLVVVATDLTIRLINKENARAVINLAFIPAIIASIAVVYAGGAPESVAIRIGVASATAYLISSLMDVFVFQKLEEKTSRINDIWFRGDRGNVLDLESMDPEEIKLALITDVDRLVAMFFDQAKENLNRDYKRVTLAIDTLKAVQNDIRDYTAYREKSLNCIKAFHTTLLNSTFLQETPKVANDGEVVNKSVKKAKELKEEIEALQLKLNQIETEKLDKIILLLQQLDLKENNSRIP